MNAAMGLLSILKKVRQKEREMRILMVGLDNAGKTTIVKKFNGEDIDTIEPTLGFNIVTLLYKGFQLNVWDVGGQTTIRSYWRNYFEQTDGLVWVVEVVAPVRAQRRLAADVPNVQLEAAVLERLDVEAERRWDQVDVLAVELLHNGRLARVVKAKHQQAHFALLLLLLLQDSEQPLRRASARR